MDNTGAQALAQLNGMQPLLVLFATPVFVKTKYLPGEISVENIRKMLEIIEASSLSYIQQILFYHNIQGILFSQQI